MAANTAAAVTVGRALAQGMVVQLQEAGQRIFLRRTVGCALGFMAAKATYCRNANFHANPPNATQTRHDTAQRAGAHQRRGASPPIQRQS
jgi:hypothetical protein